MEKVVLFGSVARGEAGEDSDIDLLVIVNDRPEALGGAMSIFERAAKGQVGCGVDVVVRTPAEWEHMRAKVHSSIEHYAEADGRTVLVASDIKEPVCDNISRMPADDIGNAAFEAAAVTGELGNLCNAIRATAESEARLVDDSDETRAQRRRNRYSEMLQDCHMAIERSLAAVRAAVDHQDYRSGHDLIKGISELGHSSERAAVIRAISPAYSPDGTLKVWRRSPYIHRDPNYVEEMTAERVADWIKAAVDCGRVVAEILDQRASTTDQRSAVPELRQAINWADELDTEPNSLENGQAASRQAADTIADSERGDPAVRPFGDLNPKPASSDDEGLGRRGFFARLFNRGEVSESGLCGYPLGGNKTCRNPRPASGSACAAGHER